MPTPYEQPNIQIFVSRRIDVNSTIVPNVLYKPMRCGAVFDKVNYANVAGDDTGDNISTKRENFCKFTVQYWAWKNVQADYYGLCHYRRYLAFVKKSCSMDEHGLTPWPELNSYAMRRFGLLNENDMREVISKYDLIIPNPASVRRMALPHEKVNTVRQLWEAHDKIFFDKSMITRLFELIDELAPQYSASAKEYFDGDKHCGYNCYIMRRNLFQRLCLLQFPIMEALEREKFSQGDFPRAPAYAGEMLFGVFCYHVITREGACALKLPLVLFAETEPTVSRTEWVRRRYIFFQDQIIRRLTYPLFPIGSRRREIFKSIYYRITGRKK